MTACHRRLDTANSSAPTRQPGADTDSPAGTANRPVNCIDDGRPGFVTNGVWQSARFGVRGGCGGDSGLI